MTPNEPNIIYPDLSYDIMAAIFEVHKVLGLGFLEAIYEKALIKELESRGIKVETQKVIDLMYDVQGWENRNPSARSCY